MLIGIEVNAVLVLMIEKKRNAQLVEERGPKGS